MTKLITKLTELREKATQGEWTVEGSGEEIYARIKSVDGDSITTNDYDTGLGVGDRDAAYIVACHNAFTELKRQSEAMERFVEAVRAMERNDGHFSDIKSLNDSWCEMRDTALREYEEAIK